MPRSFSSNVKYKFIFAEYNSAYAAETSRHLPTRARGHLSTDRNSNIFKHQMSSDKCEKACNDSYFTLFDSANTYHHLKIEEALHIMWKNTILSKQVQHFDDLLSF